MGALTVWRRQTGEFKPEVINLLQTFATQSALAIHNARLFREIQEKGHQLELASKYKSQFLASMSHELRTPMNAVLGYTRMLLMNVYGELPEKVRDVHGRIDKSGRHLLGLINDVLDFSKIEAGQLALTINPYSIKDVIQAVVSSTQSLATEKKLELKNRRAGRLAGRIGRRAAHFAGAVEFGRQRDQVHRLPAKCASKRRQRTARWKFPSRIPDREFRRRIKSISSKSSAKPKTPSRREKAAPASAWRSQKKSSSCTAARFGLRAKSAKAPHLLLLCRSADFRFSILA